MFTTDPQPNIYIELTPSKGIGALATKSKFDSTLFEIY
jgi:hypothetical protein